MLAREIPDEVLAAAVGGSNIYEQMRAFDEERAEELVRVYREHNEPLHDELVAFEGIERVLDRLRAEGRQLGIVTAKRRKTVDLAFAILPLERYFDAVVTSERDGAPQAASRAGPDRARPPRLDAARRRRSSATRPSTWAPARRPASSPSRSRWGKIHPVERLRETGADAVVHSPEELLDVL